MLRFLIVICSVLACSIAATPASADVTHHKHAVKKAVKSKHKVKANPQRIISTIRSDKAYHTRLSAVSQSDGSESVFSSTSGLQLASTKALIVNQDTGETLYAKSTDTPTPIASVTKLMTAMVMLDMHLPMDEEISVSDNDVDTLKNTTSRLRVGTTLPRSDMLQLALMSSENRAASAIARTTPIGTIAFVAAMNRKAAELGMKQSHFADPTGLNSENVATAEDLVKMVKAAYQYPEIRKCSTSQSLDVPVHGQRQMVEFRNTNILVRNAESEWDIGLSKTGYISEAGRCLVMQAKIGEQPLIIVLLDSYGKLSRIADAQRIRKWIASAS
jgi:serine-type D-Ala-D-Ala endopeptidase (penicillin-binding protein 7)